MKKPLPSTPLPPLPLPPPLQQPIPEPQPSNDTPVDYTPGIGINLGVVGHHFVWQIRVLFYARLLIKVIKCI